MEDTQTGVKEMEKDESTDKGMPDSQAAVDKKSTKKTKKKMSKPKLISLIVVLVVIWLAAVQIYAADRYKAVVNVVAGENVVGINPTTELLDYGDLSRDNASSRFIKLENTGNCFLCLKNGEKFVMVWKFGQIGELMTLSDNNITLKPGEEYRLELNVYVPVSAEIKKYTGKVWVFKLPKLF